MPNITEVYECRCGHRLARHTYFGKASPCTRCPCADYKTPRIVDEPVRVLAAEAPTARTRDKAPRRPSAVRRPEIAK
ncbi:MAG TPA: hypothetical protein VM534_05030 [Thermoanaerobaculia bacterium]|nr:hypothetical protein [Thermoanaerobaculia bacterium]